MAGENSASYDESCGSLSIWRVIRILEVFLPVARHNTDAARRPHLLSVDSFSPPRQVEENWVLVRYFTRIRSPFIAPDLCFI